MKKIKVRYRKLGREQAEGQAVSKSFARHDGLIELDERLNQLPLFSALIHETLHHALPTTHENEILRLEKEIAPIMWKAIKKHPEKYFG